MVCRSAKISGAPNERPGSMWPSVIQHLLDSRLGWSSGLLQSFPTFMIVHVKFSKLELQAAKNKSWVIWWHFLIISSGNFYRFYNICLFQAQNIVANEEEIYDVVTNLRQKTFYGRPNWDNEFGKIAQEHTGWVSRNAMCMIPIENKWAQIQRI